MFFVWATVLATHTRFRQALPTERIRLLPVKMPGHPIVSTFGIILIVALAVSTVFVQGLEWTVPLFLGWLALITLLYFLRRTQRDQHRIE
jgi:L-asparagine transporter-like permease